MTFSINMLKDSNWKIWMKCQHRQWLGRVSSLQTKTHTHSQTHLTLFKFARYLLNPDPVWEIKWLFQVKSEPRAKNVDRLTCKHTPRVKPGQTEWQVHWPRKASISSTSLVVLSGLTKTSSPCHCNKLQVQPLFGLTVFK